MKRVLLTALVCALQPFFDTPAGAHAPWKHSERLQAPLLHHISYLRPTTNSVRAGKCRSRLPVRWSLQEIPANLRLFVRNQWADRLQAALRLSSRCNDVAGQIGIIFGPYASQAYAVARCESGMSRHAVNGQYVGVFQMGSWERSTYGWYTVGAPAGVQVRSAWNYFKASGSDWSPWACKP